MMSIRWEDAKIDGPDRNLPTAKLTSVFIFII